MTDRMRPLFIFLGALALGACDGGIFGTGDGSSSTDLIVASPGSTAESIADIGAAPTDDQAGGAGSAPGTIDATVAAGAGDTGGLSMDDDSASSVDGDAAAGIDGAEGSTAAVLSLGNLVPEGRGGRLVRLVNASDRSLALAAELEDGAAGTVPSAPSSGPVRAGGTSGYVVLPPGTRSLVITGEVDLPDGQASGIALYRFMPLALAPSSVTTIFVRAPIAGNAGAADVVTLPTRVTSEEPAQALVRVVDAIDPDRPGAVYRLVPVAGPNPGSAEVALEGVPYGRVPPTADSVAPAYVPVPAGEYRLVQPDGVTVEAFLSFAAGDVRTLVTSRDGSSPIVVRDSPP